MTQPGFFDLSRRYESLDAKPDPLVALNQLIPWENFRTKLRSALEETGQRATQEARKSAAGRKPWDEVVMFKVLVLQALYNPPCVRPVVARIGSASVGALDEGHGSIRSEVQRARCRAVVASREFAGGSGLTDGWDQRRNIGALAG